VSYQINPWVAAQIAVQQNPKPVRIAQDVRRAVTVGFSEIDRPAALASLRRYCGPETPRVHRALLALSGGKLAELDAMVNAANEDYRDVLYWAEYPYDSTPGTKKKKQAAVRRMAASYRKLGFKVPPSDF
jgi:hypothetical protein